MSVVPISNSKPSRLLAWFRRVRTDGEFEPSPAREERLMHAQLHEGRVSHATQVVIGKLRQDVAKELQHMVGAEETRATLKKIRRSFFFTELLAKVATVLFAGFIYLFFGETLGHLFGLLASSTLTTEVCSWCGLAVVIILVAFLVGAIFAYRDVRRTFSYEIKRRTEL
jgi:hypothetical protein